MKSKSMYAVDTFLRSGKASQGSLFLTLTFAENVSSEQSHIIFNRFLVSLRRYYEENYAGKFGYPRKLRYFAVRELQDRGVYHYHLLFIDLRFLPFSLISKMWAVGFVFLEYIRGSQAIKYMLKYMRKDTHNGARFHASYELLKVYSYDYHRYKKFWKFNYYFMFFLDYVKYSGYDIVAMYKGLRDFFWSNFSLKYRFKFGQFFNMFNVNFA
jgi:hypothetical protein